MLYNEPGGLYEPLPHFEKMGTEGIISRIPSEIRRDRIITTGLPAVVIFDVIDTLDLPCIMSNDATIGRIGAEHFLERGFRHFAFWGFKNVPWSRKRCEAFTKRIAQSGQKVQLYNGNSDI